MIKKKNIYFLKRKVFKKDDERYQNLPEEEKDKRHTNASDWYRNLSEEEKEKC